MITLLRTADEPRFTNTNFADSHVTESPQILPVVNSDVIFRRVGDGAVLLSLEDEVYYGLNAVGARVWELLQTSSGDLDELITELHREYPAVDRDVISSDVGELLRDLATSGLVQPGQAFDPLTTNHPLRARD